MIATGVTLLGARTPSPAAADTPITFLNEQFSEATFPPTSWTTPMGSWSASCPATTPATGCAARASVSGGTAVGNELLFNPTSGIPSNLQNVTLSFYSDFIPDATTMGDSAAVQQASVPGATGDFNLLASIAGGPGTPDATGTPVLHTIALPNDNLPLAFQWTSFGDSSTTSTSTWDISNVTITGTEPSTGFTVTANPISNTVYPHIVAGTPITISLSGSSNPTGDALQFAVATPPKLGTLGSIIQVDDTHATVVYSPPADACPDPNGVSGFLCSDPFTFTVHDIESNVSSPAQVDLDVLPGGAAGQLPVVTAPASESYTTLSQNGNLVQGADLSSAVSVGPSNFPDEIELDLQASSGTIELLNGVASGVTFLNGTANGGQTIDLAGSLSKLNTALGEFLYFPPSGTTPTSTINMFPKDLGPTGSGPFAQGAEVTTTINGIVTNPPPSLALPTGSLSIANNAGPLTFPGGAATGFFLTDAGASGTTQDEVLFSVSAGSLVLPASDTSGPNQLVSVQSSGNGSTFDITGTVAQINEALPDLTFDPSHLPSENVTLSASVVDPDTGLGALQRSITIKVIQAPFAFGATTFGTLENAPATVFLCGGGPGNDTLDFAITTNPIHGALVADPSASVAGSGCSPTNNVEGFVYTPANDFTGGDSFVYSITDPTTGLVSMNNTVTITVTAHQKPTAYDASAFTVEDAPVTITLCGQNPEQAAVPTLTFTILGAPANGTLTDAGKPSLNPCNQGNVAENFTYTPHAGTFTSDGTDTFSYEVSNGTVSDPATGTVNVATLTPHVIGYAATVNEDSSIGLSLCATAPNGGPTFSVVGPAHGTLDQLVAPDNGPTCPTGYFPFGYERYVPNQLFSGSDLIGYTATEGGRASTQAFIELTVAKVEIPPTATPQTVTDIAPQPVVVTLTGSSLQGSTLSFTVTSNPAHGTLSGTAPHLTYTPTIANGTDSFTFVANDGVANSPPATVTINVTTPRLASNVCYAGTPIDLGQGEFNCAASLTSLSDPVLGALELAHTSGAPNAELQLQQNISNQSAVSDTVTLTAPAGTSQWQFRYDVAGSDDTAQLTGPGLTVTLGPAGTSGASIDVQIVVFAPLTIPAPAVVSTHVLAVSGNDASVSTQVPIEIQDGTSRPTLAVARANGSGGVSFPTIFSLSPPLYAGGPAGTMQIDAGLQGTGINTFTVHAEPAVNNTAAVTPTFFLGTTNVTAAVLAGTEVITCYASPVGCPPMHAVLTPSSSGPGGVFEMELIVQSTIDGQGTQMFAVAQVARTIGPDLSTSLPNLGVGVYEAMPMTQTLSQPVELSGSTTRTVHLHNDGDVPDTFTVQAAVTLASGDASSINVGATAPGFIDLGPATDVTRSITGTGYAVAIPAGDYVDFQITDTAGPTTATASPQVVLTATSQLDPAKFDSFEVTFPTYSFRPDAVLTGPDGAPIGAGVYQQSYPGPVGNSQQAEYDVDFSHPATIDVTLADRGTGRWPPNVSDTVVVRSPNVDSNFDVRYALLQNGTSTDVTAAITGAGLTVNLGPTGAGAPTPVIAMTGGASLSSVVGHPAYYPITVTSLSSLPSGLSDVVVVNLYNNGESQLRFAGLPQPEPSDITSTVQQEGNSNRVAPFPSAGYAAGVTYGAYPDPTGHKFAYVSTYDTFDLQVASEKAAHTAYRIQMVDPSLSSNALPLWERDAFSTPFYNGTDLQFPANPLAPGTSINPTITAAGVNITAAVENGTYTTSSLGTNETTNITVSFGANSSLRFNPLKFNLINAATGGVEDVMVIDPSSIVSCTNDGYGQVQATTTAHHKLNFEAYDRTDPQSPSACMQHLSHSWITTAPLVFGPYVPGTDSTSPGGDNPTGLWLRPQPNTVLRVDTDTGIVTGNATGFVDSPLTGPDGTPDTASDGFANYYFLGTFPTLHWNTADPTNGLEVAANTLMPAAPFPLIKPKASDVGANTMDAARYFLVNSTSGDPVMEGEMDVDVAWFNGDVPFDMYLDDTKGLVLNYPAPAGTTATLPTNNNTSQVNFYNFYWNTTKNGTVTQGGCLGVPSELFVVLGLSSGPNLCLLGATVSFQPISAVPGVEAKVSQITVSLLNPGIGVKTNPEFNLNAFSGEIDLDPATQDVTKVVLDPVFGVGPPTGCQVDQNLGLVTGLLKNLLYLPCPTNFFFFNAKVTYQAGGFDTGYEAPGGIGLQFSGTLTFLNVINLTNIEADISTSPFNFHFSNSPIALSISSSIPVSANLTFSGDIGADGFSIDVSGAIVVDGVTVAGASGVLSTKGIGVCGTLAGLSIGFGDAWGYSPTVYPSGCTTSQYDVGA